MTEIDLHNTMPCHNPSCRAVIDPPGEQRRYCPQCGAAQVFVCSACLSQPGGLVRVAEDSECPRCGSIYALCAECHHPVLATIDGPMACPEGCAAGLTEARMGTHGPLANLQRTGALVCRTEGEELGEPETWELGEAISPLACRFGRVFVATARGTIRAICEDTGLAVDIWEQAPLLGPDPAAITRLALQVSRRFVYLVDKRTIRACSVIDGSPCFELRAHVEHPHCAILDDRLLVCGETDQRALKLQLHDTGALCRGEPGLLREWEAPLEAGRERQPVTWPSAGDRSFFVLDLGGNVIEAPASGEEEFEVRWANSQYKYVSAPVVQGRSVRWLAHSPARGTALMTLDIAGGEVTTRRLGGVTPAYMGPRVCTRHLYFFDGERDFREVDLGAPTAPPRPVFHGVDMSGDMAMRSFIALEIGDGRGAWLLSLAGPPGALTSRMVHTESQSRPTLGEGRSGPLSLAASDRRIFVGDTRTGEVLVYKIPRG